MKYIKKHATQVGKIQLASLLIFTLVFVLGGYSLLEPLTAHAAALTQVQDTLSDSAPSATDATHTITYHTGVAIPAGDTITLTFNNDVPATTPWDLTAITATADVTLSATTPGSYTIVSASGSCTSGAQAYYTVSSNVLTITLCSGGTGISATDTVTIGIGNGSDFIINPDTAGMYSIDIGGTQPDSGSALVYIISGVAVSVSVAENLNFVIAGTTCSPGDGLGTNKTATATTIPYGTGVTTNTFYNGCLSLTVTTNAANGYTTTIQKNHVLTSAAGKTIPDGNCDGSPNCTTSTAEGWATATNNGWAYCMNGTDATNADAAWGTNGCSATTPYFKLIPNSSATTNIMSSTSKTAAAGDAATALFRLSVPGNQEAGTYNSTLTFVSTPSF